MIGSSSFFAQVWRQDPFRHFWVWRWRRIWQQFLFFPEHFHFLVRQTWLVAKLGFHHKWSNPLWCISLLILLRKGLRSMVLRVRIFRRYHSSCRSKIVWDFPPQFMEIIFRWSLFDLRNPHPQGTASCCQKRRCGCKAWVELTYLHSSTSFSWFELFGWLWQSCISLKTHRWTSLRWKSDAQTRDTLCNGVTTGSLTQGMRQPLL